VVDADGAIVARGATPTDLRSSEEELFTSLVGLAREVVRSATDDHDAVQVGCGVGCGGPMRGGGKLVSPLNIPAWRDFPLRVRLADALGLPTFVDNDAKALALGEGWCGAARGERDFLAMVVSTGVGGGIVLDGRLLDGRDGNAGHIGHVIVEPEGRRCACGSRGCLEAEASGSAIAARTGRPAAEADAATIERTGRLVGRAVATTANLLDLRLAVVAGSVALGFGAPFFAAAQAELDERARLDFSAGARILPAGLGADGPLVGAAAVAWRGLSHR
jgi:glucokinase